LSSFFFYRVKNKIKKWIYKGDAPKVNYLQTI